MLEFNEQSLHDGITEDSGNDQILLIVDDEQSILTLLERQFRNKYNVYTASSGNDALQMIVDGLAPHVILADQRMPGMLGSEFLSHSRQYVPHAVRVVLTGYSDVKDIIASINDGHVYKFLTKPWNPDELNQAVRNCFDYYNLSTQNIVLLNELQKQFSTIQEINAELERKNDELSRKNHEAKSHLVQSVTLLTSLLPATNQCYFTNHSQTVAAISAAICKELYFSDELTNATVIAATLHDIGKTGLPERAIIPSPELLSKSDAISYQSHAQRGAEMIRSIRGLDLVAEIVAQHHEKYNGIGFPNQLEENHIHPAAMVVHLADLYHNRVYRIPASLSSKMSAAGVNYVQSQDETQYRQNQAIAYILRTSNQYNPVVLSAFLRVAKMGICEFLQLGTKPNAEDEKLITTLTKAPKAIETLQIS